jgi:sulfatase modifying factor 1
VSLAALARGAADPRAQLIAVPGGSFAMGDPSGSPDETPRRAVVAPFRLMRTEVTVAQLAAFVAATGHRTDPERRGAGHVWWRHDGRRWTWRVVSGASWRAPHGPGSQAAPEQAVVQVSQRDAIAFCAHHGLRLPSEAEWEWAARGPDGRRYVWGDQPPAERAPAARGNIGTLTCCAPSAEDGHRRVAPVGSFPAAAGPFGHQDLAGNVWEWTSSSDERAPGRFVIRGAGWGNYAWSLRAAYRHSNPPRRGLDMVGFRCAADGR